MPPSVTVRRSIRWLPDEASEPTHTVVITGHSGIFVDVRFKKGTGEVDWGFAGYRYQLSEDTVQFKHHIDSRTLDPLSVVDIGKNSTLPNGQTLECGEMVNPDTGKMTRYEEIWEDLALPVDSDFADSELPEGAESEVEVEVVRKSEQEDGPGCWWYAQVGGWSVGLGRGLDGEFWAFQARLVVVGDEDEGGLVKKWEKVYATSNCPETGPWLE
ncbi:hypothetical protein JR316_0010948 [Psilocybe cubensis]|uniref:Uncharacterized protein n=2 Tax=Psilocybe cubensis TaxID=181762 RepID=A0ACB8GNQ7_PSICU|nr:hypothetical protein JR316_0010948 [Psilocybe cubensis]KAH9477032.1 hypothetical protein JR316_0010948 [Psilocybe cubensis]